MAHFRTDMAPIWLLLEHARKKGSAYAKENANEFSKLETSNLGWFNKALRPLMK